MGEPVAYIEMLFCSLVIAAFCGVTREHRLWASIVALLVSAGVIWENSL